jgi:hypothetical protein
MSEYTYKDYCSRYTEIENYELAKADNFDGWICHHKLGECCFTKEELLKYGLYLNRTPGELIFVTRGEHTKLHHKNKKRSEKTRAKFKGNNNPFFGKKHSEETKAKMRAAKLGKKHGPYKKRAIA